MNQLRLCAPRLPGVLPVLLGSAPDISSVDILTPAWPAPVAHPLLAEAASPEAHVCTTSS